VQFPIARFGLRAGSALAPFVLILSAFSQTATAPAKAGSGGSAAEVALDLVAHDKQGAAITDLKAADFEISAGGSPVHIDDLHLVTGGPGPGHAHLVTLVFYHDVPGFARTARNVAAELVKAAPTAGVVFAVLRVDGRLRLLQEFTADRDALNKALDAATINYNRDDDAPEKRLEADLAAARDPEPTLTMRRMLLAMLLDSQKGARDPHTPSAIASLVAACRQQRVLPGRKTLVYFSSGLDWDISDPEMPGDIADVAIRSRVSVYSIDAEIVDPLSTHAAVAAQTANKTAALTGASKNPGGTGGIGALLSEQIGRVQQGNSDELGSRLAVICRATGGEHMSDSGNIRKSVQRIVDGVLTSYTAYFVPPVQEDSGRYRPIRVKTLRSGMSLEARGAYFPVPGRLSLAVPTLGEKLLGALAAPVLPSELQYRSAVLRFGGTAGATVNSIAFELPDAAQVAALAQVRDQTGAIVQRFSEEIPKQNDTLGFRRHFIAAPGQYVLETAAVDMNSGKIGAQRTKFEIPPAASGPALGDIVLVRRIEPATGAMESSEPLRCSEGKVIPNLSARLARDANPAILLFFDVLPDSRSAEKPLLELEVRRDGNLLGSVPLSFRQDSTGGPVRELAKLGTKSLRPGTYELTVVLSQGALTALRRVPVTLE
jgi:VWFA-related protein